MKILIVYAHPEPSSFNHALLNQAQKTLSDHEVKIFSQLSKSFNK